MIRAVVVDPAAPGRLAIREVAPPRPFSSEAVVRVEAISLNRGELRRAMGAEAGWRPGWDLAGTVEAAAADGSGPPAGTRVVGFLGSGAWAERLAVPTSALAVLPESVSFAQAATLPVAGLTALYALEKAGSVLGRTVLITGASGGVGHFAVQLARAAGARVVGLVRQPPHATPVREDGAHEVVVGEGAAAAAPHGPFDLVIDSVGGRTLSQALGMLAPGGLCVALGASEAAETTFNVAEFFRTGAARLYGFILFHEVKTQPAGVGLARLLRFIEEGRLRPRIAVEAPWSEIGDVARQLLDRRFPGKAVLHLAG